ncbi:MAG: carboxypeptidase-like regulatory domain-containing protein [Bacteroidota bacterium]
MERLQNDYTKMFNSSHDCLIRFTDEWSPNPIIEAFVEDMMQSKAYIHTQMMIQMKGSAGETLIKNEARAELEASLFKVKSGIISYSNSTKDRSGFVVVNISNSDIKALTDEEITAYADIVYELAISLGIKIVPYNIKTADTLLLKSRIDTYNGVLGGTRDVQTTVVVATENIAKEISRMNGRIKNELDPLIETYIDTVPDFVNQYHSSRKIVHYGIRHLNPEATFEFKAIDFITKLPLRLVRIEVVEPGDKALTDDAGVALLQIAKAGIYTITFTKPGYSVLTKANVEVGVGDVLAISVELVPL